MRSVNMGLTTLLAFPLLAPAQGRRQPAGPKPPMSWEEYEPKSTLKVAEHPTPKAKFPFVDVHFHPRARTPEDVQKLLRDMDSLNLRTGVVLFGGSGERLKQSLALYADRKRFVLFTNPNWRNIDDPEFASKTASQIEEDVRAGAVGFKIFKEFGMDVRRADGQRVPVDDPKLDPIFQACGKAKIPVVIHTGEPWTHFQPVDKYNERWLELVEFTGRARSPDRYPTWEALMGEQERLFERHPKTTFIAAHMAWRANDLGALGRMLDRLPNLYVEVGAVVGELGRQPFTAHDFFVKYQDRVLFGKDLYDIREYPTLFRIFETRDEYFDYVRRRNAYWKMYGLGLPDEVLKNLYYQNALRIIPGLDARQFPK
jgi:predicted TIM-barrel fold metal-dependent hydrolase